MTDPDTIFGRLGNRMFQMAALYAHARDLGVDFYFQNPKYFDKYADEIKKLYGDDIGYLPYVAIHLRVGGNPVNPNEPKYIDNSFYVPLCKTGYYIDAINKFPDRKFLVFSDDIPFAKTYFEGDKFAFDDSPSDLEAFNRMASCDSQIIANSSFSYWAAYLNPNPAKIVVAPTVDKWYADGIEKTICPQEWIRI
jgi:hypothetical protein